MRDIKFDVTWWYVKRQTAKMKLLPSVFSSLNSRVKIFVFVANSKVKGKVCIRANVAHQAGAYPGFRSMKRLGVFLLPPGWDASPSQGYPPAFSSPVPIYTPG